MTFLSENVTGVSISTKLYSVLFDKLENFSDGDGSSLVSKSEPAHLWKIFESFEADSTGSLQSSNHRLILKNTDHKIGQLNYFLLLAKTIWHH